MDADPRIQFQHPWAERLGEGVQILQEPEASQSGATCGVLVGYRIAEASQHPFLIALHDGPIES